MLDTEASTAKTVPRCAIVATLQLTFLVAAESAWRIVGHTDECNWRAMTVLMLIQTKRIVWGGGGRLGAAHHVAVHRVLL